MHITDTDIAIFANLHDTLIHERGIPMHNKLMVDARELWNKLEIMKGKEVCKCPRK